MKIVDILILPLAIASGAKKWMKQRKRQKQPEKKRTERVLNRIDQLSAAHRHIRSAQIEAHKAADLLEQAGVKKELREELRLDSARYAHYMRCLENQITEMELNK